MTITINDYIATFFPSLFYSFLFYHNVCLLLNIVSTFFTIILILIFVIIIVYTDAIVRGYRSGLLSTSDYNNLSQCDSMDDIKMHLGSTDYSSILSNVPSPVATSTLVHVTTKKLVEEFQYLKAHAEEPLTTFLDYCCYGYMIDNVILIVTGINRMCKPNTFLLLKPFPYILRINETL